jgi:hypothetical protein
MPSSFYFDFFIAEKYSEVQECDATGATLIAAAKYIKNKSEITD